MAKDRKTSETQTRLQCINGRIGGIPGSDCFKYFGNLKNNDVETKYCGIEDTATFGSTPFVSANEKLKVIVPENYAGSSFAGNEVTKSDIANSCVVIVPPIPDVIPPYVVDKNQCKPAVYSFICNKNQVNYRMLASIFVFLTLSKE